MAFRPYLLAAVIPASLVACGGDSGTVVPEGTHYHYVVDSVAVPTNSNQSREYGIDLDGDGAVDNQLGAVLGLLAGQGFDVQTSLDESVDTGSIILLADIQTKDFTNTSAAGLQVFLGDNPTPPACTDANDTICRHHLDGNGMFSIAANSPDNAALGGKIVNGTFTGGPGTLSLQIALGGTDAIQLDLIGARAKVSSITDSAIGTAILAGALTQDDLNTKVIPAIQMQLGPIIMRDCTDLATPPDCGCMASSTGKTIIDLFDTDPKDCAVSVMEIQSNSLIKGLLQPDVVIDGTMALSLGVKATAVKGTYTVAGQ